MKTGLGHNTRVHIDFDDSYKGGNVQDFAYVNQLALAMGCRNAMVDVA